MKEGWKYRKFKDVYPIIMGKTPPRGDKSYWDVAKQTHNRWVSIADISRNEGKVITDTKEYISDKGTKNINIVRKGSLLMSFKLTIGKMAFAGKDLYTNEAIIAIPEDKSYNLKFVYYYLLSYDWKSLSVGKEKVKGATLNKSSIGEIRLPILPLSEQQRIVSYLDSAFAKIDVVAKNAEDSLNEAKALFQSALAKMMEPKEGWEEKHLDELAENLDYKRIPVTLNKRKSGKYPYYGASGIVDYVEDYIFDGNYLLISEDGANLLARATPIAFPVTGKFWVNNHAHILEFKDSITQLFVEFYFKLIDIKEYVTGAAQPKLTQRNMNKIPIFIPSLDKQKIVVCALQNIESKVQQLQSNLTRTLSECAALKQSILRQTFE